MRNALGGQHPWTLLAAANQAVTLAVSGARKEALVLAEDNLAVCRETLRDHPYTRLAEANLRRMSLSGDGGGTAGWQELDLDVLPN